MTPDPRLVRAFVAGAWYPVRILKHWHDDWWVVEGHALPPEYRRMNGKRRVAVQLEDLRDLRGQPILLVPPACEDRALDPSRVVRQSSRPPAPAASED